MGTSSSMMALLWARQEYTFPETAYGHAISAKNTGSWSAGSEARQAA